jgi:hypothetical protein
MSWDYPATKSWLHHWAAEEQIHNQPRYVIPSLCVPLCWFHQYQHIICDIPILNKDG